MRSFCCGERCVFGARRDCGFCFGPEEFGIMLKVALVVDLQGGRE